MLVVVEEEGVYVLFSQEYLLFCLDDYDWYFVFFSGGKDSIVCVFSLLEQGVFWDCIELYYYFVDGNEGFMFMDWLVMKFYCEVFVWVFGLDILMLWCEGGIECEMFW